MEILEFWKQNKEAFVAIPNADAALTGIVEKMKELGYTALANSVKEPQYIVKTQFDQVNTQVGELNKQLDELKKAAKGNDELTRTIDDLQKKNQDWEGKYKEERLSNAIKLAAVEAKAKNVGDVLKLFDRRDLVVKEDNTVDGLDDRMKTFLESRPHLFGEMVPPGTGANPAGSAKTQTTEEKATSDFAAGLKG